MSSPPVSRELLKKTIFFPQQLPESRLRVRRWREKCGSAHGARQPRQEDLGVRQVSLEISTTQVLQHQTIAALAAALGASAASPPAPDTGGYTLSDFPEAELSQDDLDELIAAFEDLEEDQNQPVSPDPALRYLFRNEGGR